MDNYKNMYVSLFRDVTTIIDMLQSAQQKTEEMFVSQETAHSVLSSDSQQTEKR